MRPESELSVSAIIENVLSPSLLCEEQWSARTKERGRRNSRHPLFRLSFSEKNASSVAVADWDESAETNVFLPARNVQRGRASECND